MDNPRPLKRRKAMKRTIYRSTLKRTKSIATPRPGRGLVAKKQTAFLRYFRQYDFISPGGGIPSQTRLRVNGAQDPVEAAGGGQPRGFDELAALYKRYRVKKACLEMWIQGDNQTNACQMAIVVRSDAINLTSYDKFAEDPSAVFVAVGTSSTGPKYIKKEIDISKFVSDWDHDDYTSTTSTVPLNQLFFHIGALPVGGAGTFGTVNTNMRITYEIEFYDPLTPFNAS